MRDPSSVRCWWTMQSVVAVIATGLSLSGYVFALQRERWMAAVLYGACVLVNVYLALFGARFTTAFWSRRK